MIYHDLPELLRGYFDFLDRIGGVEYALEHAEELDYFQGLFRVYQNAERNPPEGVIGVGVITYAEQKLVEAQATMDKEN